MIKLVFFAICCVLAGLLFGQTKTEYRVLIGIACSILLLFLGMGRLEEIVNGISRLASYMGETGTFFPLLLKVFGITYICDFASSICKEAGYQTVSSQIEILGKISVILAGMPIIYAVIEQLQRLV